MSAEEVKKTLEEEVKGDDLVEVDINVLNEEGKSGYLKKSNGVKEKNNKASKTPFKKQSKGTKGNAFKSFLHILKKLRFLIILALLGVAGFFGYKKYMQMKSVKDVMSNKKQTETAIIEKRNLTDSITTTGTVMSAETRTLSSTIKDTKITSVDCEIGDYVNEGDILVTFSVDDINRTIADLQDDISEKKQTTAIDATGNEREYLYSYGTESMTIRDLQNAIDEKQEALNKACSAYGDAKEELEAAKAELEAAQNSDNSGESQSEGQGEDGQNQGDGNFGDNSQNISQLEAAVKSAETAVDNAYEQQEQAQKALDKANQDLTDEVYKGSNTLAKQTESYQKNVITQNDSTEDLERQLEDYKESLSDYVVVAPISGIVTALNVEEANGFSGGDMLTIQDVSTYYITTEIDEYDIPDISLDQRVVIKTDATRDDELEGVVTFISPTASTSQGSSDVTFTVKIKILTIDDRLKLGMSAKLNIIVDERENVLTVPYDAITEKENGDSVIYVVDNSKKPSTSKTSDDKKEKSEASDVITKDTPDGGDFDKSKMKSGKSMPEGVEAPEIETKEVVVEVGMEGDYYTEISSPDISEGMTVVVSEATTNGSGNSFEDSMMFNMGGGMGGMPGDGPSGMGGGPGGF